MHLSKEEEKIFAGEQGSIRQKAMELIVSLGDIFGADRLIPIESAQIAGVSYKNIGDAGLEFIRDWSSEKVTVKSTLNPAGCPAEGWEELGISKKFAEKQAEIISYFSRMGVETTSTCTPYLVGNLPKKGEHLAWSESSAVVYANSVLGACTNREGGPSALASAIIGKTANYGLHLEENRKPEVTIKVPIKMFDYSDYSALGYWVGKKIDKLVSFDFGYEPRALLLKGLCAGLATSGKIGMFTLGKGGKAETIEFTEDDLIDTYSWLSSKKRSWDLVCLGCPHLSIDEVAKVARILKGKKVVVPLWLFTSREVARQAFFRGYTDILKRSGAKLIPDTCMVVMPLEELDFRAMLTNSAKAAHYARSMCKLDTELAYTDDCIKYALGGRIG